MQKQKPLIGIIMGSDSDLPTMQETTNVCKEFHVPCEMRVMSAHRTPKVVAKYASAAHKRGIKVLVAGAGGAAHLAGVTAAYSPLPVIGVPIMTKSLNGLDSLLSIVQMPGGVPVATVAIGNGKNAGLLAIEILATSDKSLLRKLLDYKKALGSKSVRSKSKTR